MGAFAKHIIELYYRSRGGHLAEAEAKELSDWLAAHPQEAAHLQQLEEGNIFGRELIERSPAVLSRLDHQLSLKIAEKIAETPVIQRPVHRVHFLRTAWLRYAAAIAIILSGVFFYYQLSRTPVSGGKIVHNVPPPATGDVQPGFNRAVLTLSDGRVVELDSAGYRTIKDGALTIESNDGQLIYKNSTVAATNTMSTPKGGQYQLSLADGTKVWLNAASSITFPTAFAGKTREVSITGEAYFEVKPNKQKPFIVHTKTDDITVLGTSFNINAYPDENAIKTSLIDGSVKVNGTLIRPGEAYANNKVSNTNIDHDIAWKKGYFNLENVTLEQAMREFARWYDVQIVYEQGVPKEELSGRMDRNITLQDALTGLEGVAARFTLKGRTVYVSPL